MWKAYLSLFFFASAVFVTSTALLSYFPIMSVGLPSDEVAEDYKSSLEDLVDTQRVAINNLTVIAKESIEHASAISRVLENHIKQVSRNLGQRLTFFAISHSIRSKASLSDHFTDSTYTQTPRSVPSGFHSEECWHSLHPLSQSQPIFNFHECL